LVRIFPQIGADFSCRLARIFPADWRGVFPQIGAEFPAGTAKICVNLRKNLR
jgi:hypothetical protein